MAENQACFNPLNRVIGLSTINNKEKMMANKKGFNPLNRVIGLSTKNKEKT